MNLQLRDHVADVPTVLVFLKAPRPGTVKTRLAAALGHARAAAVYRQLVVRQLNALPAGWPVEIHYAPRGARQDMQRWLGRGWNLRVQVGADLGRRLTHGFAGAFARGAPCAVAIGADCPTLDAPGLKRAAAALQRREVVVGPARDGGYYLIGLRRPAPELFREIPWSTPQVLRVTRERARAGGFRVAYLETREDVDDVASWRRARKFL